MQKLDLLFPLHWRDSHDPFTKVGRAEAFFVHCDAAFFSLLMLFQDLQNFTRSLPRLLVVSAVVAGSGCGSPDGTGLFKRWNG